jgi:beta-amylase
VPTAISIVGGHLFWAHGPDNAGYYNSRPHETGFFCDGGDYDSYFGHFFLNWYSGVITDHVDQVLSLATLAFDGAKIVVKVCDAKTVIVWTLKQVHLINL